MKRRLLATAPALGLILILIIGYGYHESLQVTVSHVTVHDPLFSRVLAGKTLAHLSDLHMDGLGTREGKVLDLLEDLRPDMVVLTGDYIGWKKDVKPALDFLSKIKAGMGVYAVMGDYDYSVSRQSCRFCHAKGSWKKTGAHHVRMLKNNSEILTVKGERLVMAGLDDRDEGVDVKAVFKDAASEKIPAIVLSHNPLRFDDVNRNLPLLMLSGDTHGGQIPLPSRVWKLVGYEKNVKYNQGLFRKGRKTLYVSRGIGTSHVPFRLFCPPEIVVYHF